MSGDCAAIGAELHELITELFPVCRSLTGDGVRATLARLQRIVPLQIHEVASGTPVFDWTVPDEWNVRDAWIQNDRGERVVDFHRSNLHVVSYSVPVRARLPLSELASRLHSLPDRPDSIPYRTAYYDRDWGFCLSHRERERLADAEYDVCIDATLAPGALTYGEFVVPGTAAGEVLVSAHLCHPSLANDNLSGVAVAVMLARRVARRQPRLSWRFLFLPGTIGPITWLARNPDARERIVAGLVLSGVGDRGSPTYKESRSGSAPIDQAARVVLGNRPAARIRPFVPWGYDERQYCSPGFDLPMGCLMRTPGGEYPEYHTSDDDLSFVTPEHLADSYRLAAELLELAEADATYVNTAPMGEPQLGRRGLYGPGASDPSPDFQRAMLWVLNRSDGRESLLAIAGRAGLPFALLRRAATALESEGLLRAV
jgi:aminopeptidase-like protein